MALALVVVVSAGLLIDSVARLLAVDPGFHSRNILKMDISTPETQLYYGPPVNGRFCQQLNESAGGLPGVEHVGAMSFLPLHGNAGRGFDIEGKSHPNPDDQPGAGYLVACPGSFATLGISVLEGRDFTDADTKDAPAVAMVNEKMARQI